MAHNSDIRFQISFSSFHHCKCGIMKNFKLLRGNRIQKVSVLLIPSCQFIFGQRCSYTPARPHSSMPGFPCERNHDVIFLMLFHLKPLIHHIRNPDWMSGFSGTCPVRTVLQNQLFALCCNRIFIWESGHMKDHKLPVRFQKKAQLRHQLFMVKIPEALTGSNHVKGSFRKT